MSLRLAAGGKLIGLTDAQILAISTTLTSLGVNAEAGGTAFTRVFAEMDEAVQTNSANLAVFNQVVGGDFAALFRADPSQAVAAFTGGIQDIIDSGGNVHATLQQLGFDNVRIRDAILRTAGAEDLLAETLQLGTQAWRENSALTREAELRYGTAASQIQFTKNRVNDLAITIGSAIVPSITRLLDALEPAINAMNNFADAHPNASRVVAILGATLLGLSGVLFGVAAAMKAVAFVMGPVNALTGWWTANLIGLRIQLFLQAIQTKVTAAAQWLWNAATATGRAISSGAIIGMIAMRAAMLAGAVATGIATVAQWALNVALTANPIGLIIVGIAALIAIIIAVALVIWKFRDTIIGAFGQALEWAKKNWPLILAILTGPIGLAIYAIWKFKDQIIAVFNAIKDAVPDWLKKGISAVFSTAGNVKDLLGFAEGGEVPGPAGAPRAAIVHGGEMVLPQRVSQMVMNLAAGPQAFAPALPSLAPVMKSVTNTFSFGDIQLSIANASPNELQRAAVDFRRYLADQLEDLADDFDSPILR